MKLQPTGIDHVVEESLHRAQSQLTRRDVVVLKNIPKDLPEVFIDEGQMTLVFDNLIFNAFQAMGMGGRLTIQSYQETLYHTDHAFREGDSILVCELKDTGHGIPQETLNRVFDSNARDSENKDRRGLIVTREIVENHQGLIEFERSPHHGTIVRVKLPLT